MIEAIDRLFKRLAATYGARWDASLGQTPIADVKTVWAHELSFFSGQLHRIAWALDNLPERCPNVIEFKNICRQAPSPALAALPPPPPKADPARVAQALQKLVDTPAQVDHKAWAHAILRDVQGGIRRNPTVVLFARQALGLA